MINKYQYLVFRFIVGGVLVYASISKIIEPNLFARSIANYHLLPYGLENVAALVLAWLELIVGTCLILGIMIDGASLISAELMGLFIVAMSVTILRGYDIECGCGLKEGELVGLGKIAEDFIYLGLSIMLVKRKNKHFEIYSI